MAAEPVSRDIPFAASAAAAHALLDGGLSTASRFAHLALLLAALAMSAAIASLWFTEPALPIRTHVAFGLVVLIGLGWAAFASWVLTTRQVLLGRHRVVAGWMAVTATSVFTFAGVAVGATGQTAGYTSAALGVVMIVVAVAMLRRARRAVAQLTARRVELERTLAGRG